MRLPRVGDVVEVHWNDSESIQLGWSPRSAYKAAAARPQGYRTSGYYLGKAKGRTLIGLSVDPVNQQANGVMAIPTCDIRDLQVLGRATKRTRKALR